MGRVVVGGGDRTGQRRGSGARGSKVAEGAAGRGRERRSADTPWARVVVGVVPRGGVTSRPANSTALRSARRRERRVAQARGAGAGDCWAEAFGRVRGSSRRAQQGDRGAQCCLAWNFQGVLVKFRGGAESAPPPARGGSRPLPLPPPSLQASLSFLYPVFLTHSLLFFFLSFFHLLCIGCFSPV